MIWLICCDPKTWIVWLKSAFRSWVVCIQEGPLCMYIKFSVSWSKNIQTQSSFPFYAPIVFGHQSLFDWSSTLSFCLVQCSVLVKELDLLILRYGHWSSGQAFKVLTCSLCSGSDGLPLANQFLLQVLSLLSSTMAFLTIVTFICMLLFLRSVKAWAKCKIYAGVNDNSLSFSIFISIPSVQNRKCQLRGLPWPDWDIFSSC